MDAAHALFAPLVGDPVFREIERRLLAGERHLALAGLVEGARALTLALLRARTRRRLLLVVPDDAALDAWRRELAAAAALAGEDGGAPSNFPALDADPWDDIAPHPEVVRAEFGQAGFALEAESPMFANPDDSHTLQVFDPEIRGRTDRFVMRFRRPGP